MRLFYSFMNNYSEHRIINIKYLVTYTGATVLLTVDEKWYFPLYPKKNQIT